MKRLCFFIFTFLISFVSYANKIANEEINNEKKYAEAEALYFAGNYEQALPIYLSLDSSIKESINLKYKIGVCYLNSSIEKDKSIKYLELAASKASVKYTGAIKDKYAPIISYEFLAKAYHLNYQFDEAITNYQKLLNSSTSIDKAKQQEIKRQIEICKNGKEISSIPVQIKIDNLGPTINSKYADYSPVFNADESTLIYTSRRKGTTGDKTDKNGKYHEDIYVSYRTSDGWTTPLGIGPSINSDGNEATVALSIDGQKLVLYKEDNGNANLYTSTLEGNTWSAPKKMNDYINSPYNESGASISADGLNLYFTSNMPGGFGGKDIYRSKKLPNGEWGRPVNMGSTINTPYDEESPYIHPDGFTLFFSSQGHKSIGGHDVFFSSMTSDTGRWSAPLNMGYPVNTTDDDLFFVPTVGNKRAYYSSYKKGGYGDKDIYMISFTGQRETPLTVYKGTLTDADGNVPPFASITITDLESNDIIGDYFANSSTGRYLYILVPGKSYQLSYTIDGEEVMTDKIKVPEASSYGLTNKAIELEKITLPAKK